jgi:hypothetical protein
MNVRNAAAVPLCHAAYLPRPAFRLTRLRAHLLPAIVFFSACAVSSAQQAIKTGPEVGATVPMFDAPDQNGKRQDLKNILGPKGAMLVFYRSADW